MAVLFHVPVALGIFVQPSGTKTELPSEGSADQTFCNQWKLGYRTEI